MLLYIAEKPSLARAIAEVMPKPHKREKGYIKTGNGIVVSWCIGHLLEQAPPDAYDVRLKKWKLNDLPIIPEKWVLLPKSSTEKQLAVLRQLIEQADEIVHAGDPDREGQLLVDEILAYCRLPKLKIREVKRCLINDLNPAAVKNAINNLRLNQDFISLSISALARSRADWLYGINMSRLYTIKGRQLGRTEVLSVGRVQTPLLGLVVRRDAEIDQFIAKPFFEVYAMLETESNHLFRVKWQPSEACAPYQDEEGRILSKSLAQNVADRIINQVGEITELIDKEKSIPPPLPLNLSTLQIEMAKKTGMSAKSVLDSCQILYEKYNLITYPRSDSRHLPQDHLQQVNRTVEMIRHNLPQDEPLLVNADFDLRSKAWSNKNIQAHHAIIPTKKRMDINTLTSSEREIYRLIAHYYLAQFYPVYRYIERFIAVSLSGGRFTTKKAETRDEGWKTIVNQKKEEKAMASDSLMTYALKKGDKVNCINTSLMDKETQPPKPFNDASLLSAMTGIARFVNDPQIRKTLRETDGLGTEATRAGIIELLFKRQYLVRQGKQIKATELGKQLIANLPNIAANPDLTALWEQQLESISKKELNYQTFMGNLDDFLQKLIRDLTHQSFN